MEVKESSFDNKGKIALAVLGIGAAGALAYWVYKKFSEPQTPDDIPHPNELANKASVSSNATSNNSVEGYDHKFARIINETRNLLDASRNQITSDVVSAIIRGQYDLANQDIKALIFKSRKERRAKLQDTLQYAKIVTKFQLDLQEIQEKHLGAILARFNIDKAEWKEACNTWEVKKDNQGQGLADLIREEQSKQLLSLRIPNSKIKNYLFVEEILKFKIQTLQVLNPTQLGVELAADDAAKYDLIETYVKDLVFKKFHIEQEDIQYSIEQMGGMDKEKVAKLEDEIGFLMQKFIGEEDEEEKSNDFY